MNSTILPEPIILTVIMNKGGVGKTTTCCNLAGALSEQRSNGKVFKTALIDLDPQTNFSSVFGLDELYELHGNDLTTIAEFLDVDNYNVPSSNFFYQVPRESCKDSLFLLPGHLDLESFKDDIEFGMKFNSINKASGSSRYKNLYNEADFERKKGEFFNSYRKKLKKDLAGVFDYVVIDTPPSRGFLTQLSLGLSDYVLLVLCPGTKEIDGLIAMEDLIAGVWANHNPSLNLAGVLINDAFERECLTQHIRKEVFDRYDGKDLLLKNQIPHSVRVAEGLSNDETIFESTHPSAEVHKSHYRAVLQELYNKVLVKKGDGAVSPELFYKLHYSHDENNLRTANG